MTNPDLAAFSKAELGTHRIDYLADQMRWSADFPLPPQQAARALAYAAGKMACQMCRRLQDQKSALAYVALRYEKLETIARLAKDIANVDAEMIGGVVYREAGADDAACPIDALNSALDEAHCAAFDLFAHVGATASAIDHFLNEFPLPKSVSPPRGDILLREFVYACAHLWEAFTGSPFPRSKLGPAVRFMAAAWTDLGFHELRDLEGSIGAVAERVDR